MTRCVMEEHRRAALAEQLTLMRGHEVYVYPDGWRADFIKLLEATDATPTEAAQYVGVPWVQVRKWIKQAKDNELKDLIEEAREALFESRLENPREDDYKNHQVFKTQLTAFSSLVTDDKSAAPLDLNEIENLRAMRQALVEDYQRKQLADDKQQEINKIEMENNDA